MDKNERFWIGTTRFTNYTYKENQDWRERFKWKGCIYGLNKKLPLTVPHLGLVFVLEMNNDQNKIMGIMRRRCTRKFAMNQGESSAWARAARSCPSA